MEDNTCENVLEPNRLLSSSKNTGTNVDCTFLRTKPAVEATRKEVNCDPLNSIEVY
ncbi:hypothetical protein PUN28_010713 [Cardiocondyla obscurior]|uniref:Uncharacterized protein n=1 Tax=Cardiocondyla obscurior TaxID=286306 RepID=A0AAW2FIW3_9HYME